MPAKLDESTSGIKTLKIFKKLLLFSQKHYQAALASEFNCSAQTIIRIMNEIESVIGTNLETGLDCRRKWYRIRPGGITRLGLDFEELRYLAICRDLAAPVLPAQVLERVDETIFNLSVQMAAPDWQKKDAPHLVFYSKGRINYTPFYPILEAVMQGIEDKKICLIRYKAIGKDLVRSHRVAPHCLVSMHQALYLLGAILTPENEIKHYVSFAIQRIKKCALTSDGFDIEFPSAAKNTFGLPWHEPRNYKIKIKAGKAAEYVAERIWSDRQKTGYDEDGNLILEITSQSEQELLAWIRSFGDEAELLESYKPDMDIDSPDSN